jgi:hypothetical protein
VSIEYFLSFSILKSRDVFALIISSFLTLHGYSISIFSCHNRESQTLWTVSQWTGELCALRLVFSLPNSFQCE